MVAEMEPSGIRRFFDVASTMDNVISLGVGEPDFDTPWHIREEGIYSLEKGRTFYTSNAGLLPLRKEVCTYLKRRFALSYDSDEVIITVGGSEAIDIAFRTMLDPGDEVIVPEPCFVSYVPCITMAGGVPVFVQAKEENDFEITEELLSALHETIDMVFLCQPNNPTGQIVTSDFLEKLLKKCRACHATPVIDECFLDFLPEHESRTAKHFLAQFPELVILKAFTKLYAMAGVRLGYRLYRP